MSGEGSDINLAALNDAIELGVESLVDALTLSLILTRGFESVRTR